MDHHKIYTEMAHGVALRIRASRVTEYTGEVRTVVDAIETLGRWIADGEYNHEQLRELCTTGVHDVPGTTNITVGIMKSDLHVHVNVNVPFTQSWSVAEQEKIKELLRVAIPKSMTHKIMYSDGETHYCLVFA